MKQSATQQSYENVGFRSSTQPTQLKLFGTNSSVLSHKERSHRRCFSESVICQKMRLQQNITVIPTNV
ncbi:hypothetical protein IQ229_00680 [Nostoc cf. edaphicum LEGE 07299]|uniref:Uncharacterized protein n=1 Tax=Nostoc cf. edaphicum LEGE 07299 TaxID=2777974 RepID=A0ABR9TV04_9NOSO|nr:hypothetical protein [Nostoc edaphicum]MBE9103515.1 hypothetical protein [Nostoc cf. edaphicum LEGE 07299]